MMSAKNSGDLGVGGGIDLENAVRGYGWYAFGACLFADEEEVESGHVVPHGACRLDVKVRDEGIRGFVFCVYVILEGGRGGAVLGVN